MISRPVTPSSIKSVFPPIPEATGSAVAIASRSELLIPSARLGSTGVRGSQVLGRLIHSARELNSLGDAQRSCQLLQSLPFVAWANQDQAAGAIRSQARPRFEQEQRVLLGMEAAREEGTRGRGEEAVLDHAPSDELLGIDPAVHSHHSIWRDTEAEPLAAPISAEIAAKPVFARIALLSTPLPRVRPSSSASP